MQEMFEKLERLKYGNESIRQSNRMIDYWDEYIHDDELDDVESYYEYMIEHNND